MTIMKIEDQNYEHLTFLTTYIVPFLRVNLKGTDLLISVLLLIIIGAIFVKTNLFYKNPTLALLGYKLYKVDAGSKTGLIYLSKEELKEGDTIAYQIEGDRVVIRRAAAESLEDPFATFSEWNGEADQRAYGKL